MLLDVIANDFEHRCILIGIDNISNIQSQRFVTANRYFGRYNLVRVIFYLCKKVNDLSAVNIYNFYLLTIFCFYFYTAARVDYIFVIGYSTVNFEFQLSLLYHSFRQKST